MVIGLFKTLKNLLSPKGLYESNANGDHLSVFRFPFYNVSIRFFDLSFQVRYQTTALLLFGWIFGVQLDSLEKK